MNGYHTEQDREDGLTTVVCDLCEARHVAGAGFIHKPDCPEFGAMRPRRKTKAITRVIHFQVYAEVDEKGQVIIP